jgi:DNA polymerase-3 subunit alpha
MKLRPKWQNFAHLHLHTEYSFLDSIIKVKGFGELLKSRGFRACAQTEHGNVNGTYQFHKELTQAGIKPILGCEFYFVQDRTRRGLTAHERVKAEAEASELEITKRQAVKEAEQKLGTRKRNHVVILAKNNQGWRKILRAVELSYKEGFYWRPRIDAEILPKLGGDCILLTACVSGIPCEHILNDRYDLALKWCREYQQIFGEDFYIEIQPNDLEDQVRLNIELVSIAEEIGAKIVATNDTHYISSEDSVTHDVMLALRSSQGGRTVLVSDPDRFRYPTDQLYLKSRPEMEKSFRRFHPELDQAEWESALDNTIEIAEKVDSCVIEKRKAVLPVLKIDDPEETLWGLVREGWKWRKVNKRSRFKKGVIDWVDGKEPEERPLKEVCEERVKFEMDEITRLGFTKYFLVVHDLVKWAREAGIRVGPGRGSVGGSYVAYLLGITSLDSIKYGCPWSRFISPERVDFPDIDCDVPSNERERIRRYLTLKYGKARVAGICNISRMKGRAVLKDVGRVFGVSWKETETITKQVLQRDDNDERAYCCVEDTFNEIESTRWYKKKYPHVVNHAMKLEGNVRHLGVHAAGVVISDQPLRNHVPVQFQRDKDKPDGVGDQLVGWDKKEVEAVGLLKLDVLGVEGLSYIQRTIELVKERRGERIEPENWQNLTDENVYRNLAMGNTELVWQMNTFHTTQVLKQLVPGKFEHVVATSALIRQLLEPTYGLMVYQEDVIRIVHRIGGFTLGEADQIRKDIGKKKGVEYLQKTYLERFAKGAERWGIGYEKAKRLWYQISEFGKYGFNRSHATAYSILSYWTMYLKLYYSLEFMTAALGTADKADKRRSYIKEAKRLGLTVTGPDVNISSDTFAIDPNRDDTIRAGLVDVKGIGKKTVQTIVANAPYKDLRDFVERSGANKTAVSALLRIGALDTLVDNPKYIDEILDKVLHVRKLKGKDKYWDKLDLNQSGKFPTQEREKYLHDLVGLPPVIHPATTAVDWLTEHCEHISWRQISDFDHLFDYEYSNNYAGFVGSVTEIKIFEAERSSEEKSLENRSARVILEDDTGQMTARISGAKMATLSTEFAEGMILALVGRSTGSQSVSAGAIADLGPIMQGEDRDSWVVRDGHRGFREFLRGRDTLKTFRAGKGRFRAAVTILGVEHWTTKKKQKMLQICAMDMDGEIRHVLLWPSDYQRYGDKFEEGSTILLRLKSKLEGGKDRSYFVETDAGKNPIMPLDKYYAHHMGKQHE